MTKAELIALRRVDEAKRLYGLTCFCIATQAAALEVQLNTVTCDMDDWPLGAFDDEIIKNVDEAKQLAARIVTLLNTASYGWSEVDTIDSAWVKTLPEGHPDKR